MELSSIAKTLIAFRRELGKNPSIARHLRQVSARRDYQRKWYIRVHVTSRNVQIPREHHGIRVVKIVSETR